MMIPLLGEVFDNPNGNVLGVVSIYADSVVLPIILNDSDTLWPEIMVPGSKYLVQYGSTQRETSTETKTRPCHGRESRFALRDGLI